MNEWLFEGTLPHKAMWLSLWNHKLSHVALCLPRPCHGLVGDNLLFNLKALIIGPLPRFVFFDRGSGCVFGGGRVVEEVRKKERYPFYFPLQHPHASQKFGKYFTINDCHPSVIHNFHSDTARVVWYSKLRDYSESDSVQLKFKTLSHSWDSQIFACQIFESQWLVHTSGVELLVVWTTTSGASKA